MLIPFSKHIIKAPKPSGHLTYMAAQNFKKKNSLSTYTTTGLLSYPGLGFASAILQYCVVMLGLLVQRLHDQALATLVLNVSVLTTVMPMSSAPMAPVLILARSYFVAPILCLFSITVPMSLLALLTLRSYILLPKTSLFLDSLLLPTALPSVHCIGMG